MEEKWAAAIINFFFERDFAQQPKSALILTTLHVLFDTLYVNCKDQIMALAATICSTSKETLSKNPYALGVILLHVQFYTLYGHEIATVKVYGPNTGWRVVIRW